MMMGSKTKSQTEIPEDVEVVRYKESKRGRRSQHFNMTGPLSARHKPHKHHLTWDALEAFVATAEKE